jgi:hypothetical protein
MAHISDVFVRSFATKVTQDGISRFITDNRHLATDNWI